MPTPPPTPPPADPPPTTGPAPAPSESALESTISKVLGTLIDAGHVTVTDKPTPTTSPATPDIRAQVLAAVRQAQTEQEQASVVATLRADMDTLKATKQPETPPVVRRRVERFMGWHVDG